MAGSERGSMDDLRGQIFTVLGIYEVTFFFIYILLYINLHVYSSQALSFYLWAVCHSSPFSLQTVVVS